MLGIIINPKSGRSATRKKVLYVLRQLRKHRIDSVHRMTKYATHATELARELVESGVEHLLVLGGDGTLSEVIDGVMHADITQDKRNNIEIGLLPSGTGNDWGRYWGLNKDYKKSLTAYLEKSIPKMIDVGCLTFRRNGKEEKHYFINSVGFGVDAKTVQRAEVMKYYVGSHGLNYFFGLLSALFIHKSLPVHLTTDNGVDVKDSLFTMNIANGPYSGGGIKQNPDADPQDGIFHAMLVTKLTAQLIKEALPNLFNGRIKDVSFIKFFTAKHIKIQTNKHITIEKDGILVNGCGPYEVNILPAALKMIVPDKGS